MDLAWSAADSAFRDEVHAFLQEKLTPEVRQAGRLMTSVYADHGASVDGNGSCMSAAGRHRPVEYGGCDWSLTNSASLVPRCPKRLAESAVAQRGGRAVARQSPRRRCGGDLL